MKVTFGQPDFTNATDVAEFIKELELALGSLNLGTLAKKSSLGTVDYADLSVTTIKLAALAVTTAKIADAAVTLAKIVSGTQGDVLYAGASGLWAALAAGTSGYLLQTNGAGANPSWVPPPAAGGSPVLAASVPTTSGTSIDFTGIPSGTKHFWLNLAGVSVNAVNQMRLQIGPAGGPETSGYTGDNSFLGVSGTACTALGGSGFDGVAGYAAADGYTGQLHFYLTDASTNTWTCVGMLATNGTNSNIIVIVGSKSCAGMVDRVRLTTAGGATFDAGKASLGYDT